MSKAVIGGIISMIAIVAIVGVVLVGKEDSKPVASTTSATENHSEMDMSNESGKPSAGTTTTTDSNATAAQTASVEIKNYAYAPAKIQVKKGTTVKWTNQDSVRHDVTPDNPSEAFKASQLLSKGESYSFTFNTVGTYTYICSPHPYMKGTVEVIE